MNDYNEIKENMNSRRRQKTKIIINSLSQQHTHSVQRHFDYFQLLVTMCMHTTCICRTTRFFLLLPTNVGLLCVALLLPLFLSIDVCLCLSASIFPLCLGFCARFCRSLLLTPFKCCFFFSFRATR